MLRKRSKTERYSRARIPNARLRATQEYLYNCNAAFEDRIVRFQQNLFLQAYRRIEQASLPAPARVTHGWRRQVEARLPGILHNLKSMIWSSTQQAAAAAYAGGYWGKAWQLDQITNREVHLRFSPRLPTPKLREDVYDSIIQQGLIDYWGDLYAGNLETMAGAIKTALWISVAQGESFDQSMQRVAAAMGIVSDTGYKAAFNRIQALTRMVIARTINEAAWELFKELDDIVTQWEWLTARDERVCPRCSQMDMTRFEAEEGWYNLPPAHTHCRCWIIPVARYDWMYNGMLHPQKPFVEWLNSQGYDLRRVLDQYLSTDLSWLGEEYRPPQEPGEYPF